MNRAIAIAIIVLYSANCGYDAVPITGHVNTLQHQDGNSMRLLVDGYVDPALSGHPDGLMLVTQWHDNEIRYLMLVDMDIQDLPTSIGAFDEPYELAMPRVNYRLFSFGDDGSSEIYINVHEDSLRIERLKQDINRILHAGRFQLKMDAGPYLRLSGMWKTQPQPSFQTNSDYGDVDAPQVTSGDDGQGTNETGGGCAEPDSEYRYTTTGCICEDDESEPTDSDDTSTGCQGDDIEEPGSDKPQTSGCQGDSGGDDSESGDEDSSGDGEQTTQDETASQGCECEGDGFDEPQLFAASQFNPWKTRANQRFVFRLPLEWGLIMLLFVIYRFVLRKRMR